MIKQRKTSKLHLRGVKCDDRKVIQLYLTKFRTAFYSVQLLFSGNMFVGLQCSMLNYWTHATLVAMMKGDDVDEQKGTKL